MPMYGIIAGFFLSAPLTGEYACSTYFGVPSAREIAGARAAVEEAAEREKRILKLMQKGEALAEALQSVRKSGYRAKVRRDLLELLAIQNAELARHAELPYYEQ